MKLKVWKVGDRSRGLCERCVRVVSTRFERRPLQLEDVAVPVPDLLVGVCEECAEVISIPPQSMPRINAARRREPVRLEARIPKALDEILQALTAWYAGREDAFQSALLRYYLHEMANDPEMAGRVKRLASGDAAACKCDGRVHFRVEKPLLDRAERAMTNAGIADRSEMVRGVILAALEDTESATAERKAALRAIAIAAV